MRRHRSGAAEVGLLRGADGGIAVVVQHEELDGKLKAVDRFKLLDVELEAAVAVDQRWSACGRDGDSRRRSPSGVRSPSLRGRRCGRCAGRCAWGRREGRSRCRSRSCRTTSRLPAWTSVPMTSARWKMETRPSGLRCSSVTTWVARLPVGAALVPVCPVSVVELLQCLELRQKFVEEGAGIGADGLLQMRVELAEFGRSRYRRRPCGPRARDSAERSR